MMGSCDECDYDPMEEEEPPEGYHTDFIGYCEYLKQYLCEKCHTEASLNFLHICAYDTSRND